MQYGCGADVLFFGCLFIRFRAWDRFPLTIPFRIRELVGTEPVGPAPLKKATVPPPKNLIAKIIVAKQDITYARKK